MPSQLFFREEMIRMTIILLGSLYLLLGFTDLIIIDVVLFLGQVEFSHCSHAIL